MTKAAITTIGAALLVAAALALSGCSYRGDDEDRAAFHAEAQDPVPSAPATEPTEPETPAEETGDESTEEGGQGEKSGATADLGVEDGQVQYLRAIQNFSPALERWVLDEEAGEVTKSEEHTSELQSRGHLVCRLLLEKKKNNGEK